MKFFFAFSFLTAGILCAQNYTSHFTGSTNDVLTNPSGGMCLMGGATENDEAMKWFLQRANGGDILVLRTTGSNGYNNYLYSTLGITVNSVETIVCNNAQASNDAYVIQKISQAEGIWFAGGDQWDYISFWRNTPVDSAINAGIQSRKIVIGGISAGMAIQGKFYFTAQNGTVTSATAMANPYSNTVTVDSSSFIKNEWLSDVITDTHYDNPDRKGRHATFLARILTDYGVTGKGIACDEYTAVCIDTSGLAKIYGDYPAYTDVAYFIQPNCDLPNSAPETCSAGNPLVWNHGGQALKVYKVNGTSTGANTFDLTDWKTGTGGTWEHWSVSASQVVQAAGTAPVCVTSFPGNEVNGHNVLLWPNPATDNIHINLTEECISVEITDIAGRIFLRTAGANTVDVTLLPAGVYSVIVSSTSGGKFTSRLIKQ